MRQFILGDDRKMEKEVYLKRKPKSISKHIRIIMRVKPACWTQDQTTLKYTLAVLLYTVVPIRKHNKKTYFITITIVKTITYPRIMEKRDV